jgi:hypothetical protein
MKVRDFYNNLVTCDCFFVHPSCLNKYGRKEPMFFVYGHLADESDMFDDGATVRLLVTMRDEGEAVDYCDILNKQLLLGRLGRSC